MDSPLLRIPSPHEPPVVHDRQGRARIVATPPLNRTPMAPQRWTRTLMQRLFGRPGAEGAADDGPWHRATLDPQRLRVGGLPGGPGHPGPTLNAKESAIMRVVVGERVGGPEVLSVAEREAPRPGSGEVVVEVAAAGVNYMDIYQREGVGNYRTDPPFVPGAEGAGTVVAVGSDVKDLSVGDHVAWAGQGSSYAEQVALSANRVVPVPDGMNLQVAAAAILQGMTAHYLCTSTYPVREGDITVVHAAAGGVGLLLTQLVKRRGGLVVGTTSGGEKV